MSAGEWKQSTVIALLIACFGIVFLFAYCVPEYNRAAMLKTSPTAVGTISQVYISKGNGQFANYSFEVNGKTYQGKSEFSGTAAYPSEVKVYYLASDPSISSLSPEATVHRLKVALQLLVGCLVGVLGLSVFLGYKAMTVGAGLH